MLKIIKLLKVSKNSPGVLHIKGGISFMVMSHTEGSLK